MTVSAETALLNMGLPALAERGLGESLPKRLDLSYTRKHQCLSILETLRETLRPEVTKGVLPKVVSFVPETLEFWM